MRNGENNMELYRRSRGVRIYFVFQNEIEIYRKSYEKLRRLRGVFGIVRDYSDGIFE